MIDQVLEERYLDLDKLFDVLAELFGEGMFTVEVIK
jgi:hypothetical protein